MLICRGILHSTTRVRSHRSVWICLDMRRFGNSAPRVPEIAEAGSSGHRADTSRPSVYESRPGPLNYVEHGFKADAARSSYMEIG